MDPVLVDGPIGRAIDISFNEVPVDPCYSLLECYTFFVYVLLQLFSLSLTICFIILFSDKDSEIYDHIGLGICLLIDFSLYSIAICIALLYSITKSISSRIIKPLAIVLSVAFLAGIVFCIWDIVVLAKKDYTFITFTHIVLILSVCYYGAYLLLVGGMAVANQIDYCNRPFR